MPWLMCPYDMRRVPDLLLPVTLLSLSPCVVCGLWFGNRQVGYDNTVRDSNGDSNEHHVCRKASTPESIWPVLARAGKDGRSSLALTGSAFLVVIYLV